MNAPWVEADGYVHICAGEFYPCPCCGDATSGDGINRPVCDDCRKPCPTCGIPSLTEFYVCTVWGRDGETSYSDGYFCADHVPDGDDMIPADAYVLEYDVQEIPGR